MERELNRILNNMSESTAKSYRGSYLRLRKLLKLTDRRKPIKKMSLKDILTSIENVENPSTRHSVFVIAKKIFDYEKNISLIILFVYLFLINGIYFYFISL